MNPNLLPRRRLRFLDDPPPSGEGNPTSVGGLGAGVTLTQEQITAMAAREKDQGRRAALREFAEQNGFPDPAAAAAFIQAAKDAETARMSDADRKVAEATAREQAAEARERAADARERALARKDALRDLGAAGENLTDALALLQAQVPADADDATVLTAAAALKGRRSELFTGTAPTPPAPSGAPSSRPPANGQPPAKIPGAQGKNEAARRFGPRARTGASA